MSLLIPKKLNKLKLVILIFQIKNFRSTPKGSIKRCQNLIIIKLKKMINYIRFFIFVKNSALFLFKIWISFCLFFKTKIISFYLKIILIFQIKNFRSTPKGSIKRCQNLIIIKLSFILFNYTITFALLVFFKWLLNLNWFCIYTNFLHIFNIFFNFKISK